MNEPLVCIKQLSKSFSSNQIALKSIDLSLPQGKMIGVVGPDGAGKTTLLRSMIGLLLPSEGTIQLLGKDTVKEQDAIFSFCGYMPQAFGLYEDLTVLQNLDLYADIYGLDPDQKKARYEKLLQATNLAPFTDRLAGKLSGGMKQKLGLCSTLLQEPKVLILDEPSVGVDPISRRELWNLVQSLQKEGMSVIWGTTYLKEAEKCDLIVLLNHGELIFTGPPKELIQRVKGKVFHVESDLESKRELLCKLEEEEGVIDASMKANGIRVVKSEGSLQNGKSVEPCLEDAFVDILGGIQKDRVFFSEKAEKIDLEEGDAVVANNLTKTFQKFTAVHDVSFSVKKGEIFGLLGPNGAGKSTTFKMLNGLLNPSSGASSVNGIDLQKEPSKASEQIGYMAQKFALYQDLSVLENLKFFQGIYPKKGSLEERLSLFSLESRKDRTTSSLSLGYKQKLSLSVATIHWPKILFLDEPTSGMDPVSRRVFWSNMNRLVQKGYTILISTHFMDEAQNCDRIALIYRGELIELNTPKGLQDLVRSEELPNPSLEDAFVQLIKEFDAKTK